MSEPVETSLASNNVKDESMASEVKLPPNLVDFDGPADSENPLNWTQGRKWIIVFITACMTFITQVFVS